MKRDGVKGDEVGIEFLSSDIMLLCHLTSPSFINFSFLFSPLQVTNPIFCFAIWPFFATKEDADKEEPKSNICLIPWQNIFDPTYN